MSHEVVLGGIGENLFKASSAREAFECLLKNEVGLILIDVCMPELDGFELAAMIREHPRFQRTAIIFVSAVNFAHLGSGARLPAGRGRLRAGSGGAGAAARQGQGVRRSVPQDPPARDDSMPSSRSACSSAPRSCAGSTRSSSSASRSARASGRSRSRSCSRRRRWTPSGGSPAASRTISTIC